MELFSFEELYNKQIHNQNILIARDKYEGFMTEEVRQSGVVAPFDDPKLASYHVQQLISEIGEVLDADKRWKSFRAEKYDAEGKLEELSDCFIVLMNVAIFSGIDAQEMYKAIDAKLDVVRERIERIL